MDEKERASQVETNSKTENHAKAEAYAEATEPLKEDGTAEKAKNLKDDAKTNFSTYLTISQVGLVMIIPMILGAAFGHWIDQKLGTDGLWSVILLLLGIAGGFYGAYNQIAAVIKKKK